MSVKRILILDYSVNRGETAAFKRWLPKEAQVTSCFIDTAESFPDDLIQKDFTHVIHSGSELTITKPTPFTKKAVAFIRGLVDKHIPQMGVCFGHQLVAFALLGPQAVRQSPAGFEAGWREVSFLIDDFQIPGVSRSEILWQHHFDEVIELPQGSRLIATSPHTRIQAYINPALRLLGTQFHPEFDKLTGNAYFAADRALLASHHYDVDEIMKSGPSIDSGTVFFDFFLAYFK